MLLRYIINRMNKKTEDTDMGNATINRTEWHELRTWYKVFASTSGRFAVEAVITANTYGSYSITVCNQFCGTAATLRNAQSCCEVEANRQLGVVIQREAEKKAAAK